MSQDRAGYDAVDSLAAEDERASRRRKAVADRDKAVANREYWEGVAEKQHKNGGRPTYRNRMTKEMPSSLRAAFQRRKKLAEVSP